VIAVGKVIVVSAPSGAGKTTIVRRLLAAHPEFQFSVSATTRPLRGTEVHGKDYYFLSVEQFRDLIDAGAFLEWEQVYPGRYYGSLKEDVDRIHSQGNTVLFDVDVKGALNIKKAYGDRAITLFVAPPSLEVLRERLTSRGTESEADIAKRMAKAEAEMAYAPQFDRIVVNDDLDRAVEEAESILRSFMAS
jgi:guanylate kinase